jgi:SAM-dependent methyltransferase
MNLTNAPWLGLGSYAGLQAFEYENNPRKDVHALFYHPPRRVLDVGCAAGFVGSGIKEVYSGAWVCGCELDEGAAAVARVNLDKVVTKPLQEWRGDELALLADVDTVLLLDVLEHMNNPWAELQFIGQHIVNGTQVIISLPNVGNFNVLRDLSNGYWNYKPYGVLDISHVRFFTHHEMFRLFYQTGFRVEAQMFILENSLPEPDEFPAYFEADNLRVAVHDKLSWMRLCARQIMFRIRKADDEALTQDELNYRSGDHPETYTF